MSDPEIVRSYPWHEFTVQDAEREFLAATDAYLAAGDEPNEEMRRRYVQAKRAYYAAQDEERGNGLTLEGYAAVFDQWTEVDNPIEGHFMESIARGAFESTLKQRADRIPLMYDHGHHPLIGQMPLGRIESLVEDNVGLKVRAKLHDNWLVQPLRDAIRSGAMREMSFRFRGVRDRVEKPRGAGDLPKVIRTEVKLIELGPATIGVYAGTEMALRAWAAVAPPEFRSTVIDLVDNNVMMTNVRSTPPSGGQQSTGPEEVSGAAVMVEPARKVTLQDRRSIAARLRGVHGNAEPPGPAPVRAG